MPAQRRAARRLKRQAWCAGYPINQAATADRQAAGRGAACEGLQAAAPAAALAGSPAGRWAACGRAHGHPRLPAGRPPAWLGGAALGGGGALGRPAARAGATRQAAGRALHVHGGINVPLGWPSGASGWPKRLGTGLGHRAQRGPWRWALIDHQGLHVSRGGRGDPMAAPQSHVSFHPGAAASPVHACSPCAHTRSPCIAGGCSSPPQPPCTHPCPRTRSVPRQNGRAGAEEDGQEASPPPAAGGRRRRAAWPRLAAPPPPPHAYDGRAAGAPAHP